MATTTLEQLTERLSFSYHPSNYVVLYGDECRTLVHHLEAERAQVLDLISQLATARKEAEGLKSRVEAAEKLQQDAWGALNFILAFYEPNQRHLDTNAWTQAEAEGRRVHAALRTAIDARSLNQQDH